MYIEISLKKIRGYLYEMNKAYDKLRSEKYELIEVRSFLKHTDDTATLKVVEKLTKQIERLDESIANLKKLISGLEKIIKVYSQSEEAVADYTEYDAVSVLGEAIVIPQALWTTGEISLTDKFEQINPIGKIVFDSDT